MAGEAKERLEGREAGRASWGSRSPWTLRPGLNASAPHRQGSDGEWGECDAPKVYSGPGLSLHTAGLFLLLSTRLGLTLLWDGGQHPIPQSSDPCPAAPPHPESLPLVHI